MTLLLRYQTLILGVVGLFFLSTVGVPIVVAACPMMANGSFSAACCADREQPGTLKLRPVTDYSCCKTVLVAEWNTTQYVQVERDLPSPEKNVVVGSGTFLANFVLAGIPLVPHVAANPPPRILDIPIFCFSLLI